MISKKLFKNHNLFFIVPDNIFTYTFFQFQYSLNLNVNKRKYEVKILVNYVYGLLRYFKVF
jgi:hypothetical protein